MKCLRSDSTLKVSDLGDFIIYKVHKKTLAKIYAYTICIKKKSIQIHVYPKQTECGISDLVKETVCRQK